MNQLPISTSNRVTQNWFTTRSGRRYFIQSPSPTMITLPDIASALSKICRFSGHCKGFFSVAQHSMMVASALEDDLKFIGLMHDATEAYLNDMIHPIKVIMPDYKELEEKTWRVIAMKFNLPEEIPERVKQVDLASLLAEKRDLLEPDHWDIDRMPDLREIVNQSFDHPITPLMPDEAERRFLLMFRLLCPDREMAEAYLNEE